jgi:putative ABC transport system permease protein
MWSDCRYAARGFRNRPAFTLLVIATLALAIGANTAIFSVVSGVLLRPLPFADPDRLVQLSESAGSVSYPNLLDWRAQNASFESIVAYENHSKNLQDNGDPERIAAVGADRGLFQTLGVQPIAGRTFRPDDPPHVAVIGAGLWKRRYASDRALIGKNIMLDGQAFTVIGVMPRDFQFPYQTAHTELWVPLEPLRSPRPRGLKYLSTVARLKPGVKLEAARKEMAVIAQRLGKQYPEENAGSHGILVTPLRDAVAGEIRPALVTILGAVGIVLLIACVNVANLLLARGAARHHEVAIRAAVGASPGRLIRQFLTESVLLAIAGGAAGLLLAPWGSDLLLKLAASQIPRYWEIGIDWRVFAFLLAVSIGTGIGFGIVPALTAARIDVQSGLKEGRKRGSAGRGEGLLRDGLVVAEIALSFVLLMGAGLLLRTFLYLERTDPGMVTSNVLTLDMLLPPVRYPTSAAAARYYREMEDRVLRIPGVRSAGFINMLPLESWGSNSTFNIEGNAPRPPGHQPLAEFRFVSPGYFRTLGIPIRRGHDFSDRDHEVMINDAFARQYFPNENPAGKHVQVLAHQPVTIAGVVGDVRQEGLDRPPAPEIYFPLEQCPFPVWLSAPAMVVSANIRGENLVSAVRAAIRGIDPTQVIFNVKTMDRVIADSLSDHSLYVWLIGLFAGLALILAAAGIYGVISYAVTARTHEFGIRLALGAAQGRILRQVLGHGAALAGLGLGFGIAGAFALTRLLARLLVGVTPNDPATFAAAGLLLAAVALAACMIPARRAMRVDPMVALRQE